MGRDGPRTDSGAEADDAGMQWAIGKGADGNEVVLVEARGGSAEVTYDVVDRRVEDSDPPGFRDKRRAFDFAAGYSEGSGLEQNVVDR